MKLDFHYGVIKILARAAGFREEDAETIAYASQYTDDASYHSPIRINKLPPKKISLRLGRWMKALGIGRKHLDRTLVRIKHNGKSKHPVLDPICTAHKGFHYVKGVTKDAQRKVYISFHFIPAKKHVQGRDYEYLTEAGGNLVDVLMRSVLTGYKKVANKDDRRVALVALGIALHSYADSWAHEGFSGKWDQQDNDLESVRVNGRVPDPTIVSFFGKLVPVGHLDASDHPDRTDGDLELGFQRGAQIKRNNSEHFLESSWEILSRLASLNKIDPDKAASSIWPTLEKCLRQEMDADLRLTMLEEEFRTRPGYDNLELAYNSTKWESMATRARPTRSGAYELEFRGKDTNELWFDFHIAAAAQRAFVKSHIKPL